MKKKLIGLALSAAMLFSVLSVPAFAAAPEESADPALTTEQTAAEEENCFFTSSSTEEEKEPQSHHLCCPGRQHLRRHRPDYRSICT